MSTLLIVSRTLSFLSGTLFRRYWGGWLSPENWHRKALLVALAGVVAYTVTASVLASLALTGAIVYAFWFPQGHGRTQDMGYGNPNGTLPLGFCVTQFHGIYATPMQCAGLLWFLTTGQYAGLVYAFLGLLAPVGHLMAQWLPDKIVGPIGSFIDNKTAVGELFLGALLIGGIPASEALLKALGIY